LHGWGGRRRGLDIDTLEDDKVLILLHDMWSVRLHKHSLFFYFVRFWDMGVL
jgi:hypothetical protein